MIGMACFHLNKHQQTQLLLSPFSMEEKNIESDFSIIRYEVEFYCRVIN